MKLIKEFNEDRKYLEIVCKRCGWKNHLYLGDKKKICINCGYYIFKDDKSEFKYKLKEMLR